MSSLRFAFFFLGLILFICSVAGFIGLKLKAACETDEYLSLPKAACEATTIPGAISTATPLPSTPTNAADVLTGTPAPSPTPALVVTPPETSVVTVPPTPAPSPAPALVVTVPPTPVPSPTSAPMESPVPFTPVPPTPLPPIGGQLNLWFRSTPVAPLGIHIVQPHEYLFCIGRAYGVLPQAIAEVNFFALDAPLFDGQPLQIPDVPWMNIPPGQVCAPQFKSPYSPASVSMITSPPNLMLGSRAISGKPWWGEDGSISGGVRLINFVLPKEQVKKVGSQLGSLAVTPSQVLTEETRIVRVKWPFQMSLGTSSQIALTLDPDTDQTPVLGATSPDQTTATATHTSEPNPLVRSVEESVSIPDVFDKCRVFATARLNAAGFSYSPIEENTQQVNRGKRVTWRWSIKALDVGQQDIIISLGLHFKPKNDPQGLGDCQVSHGDEQISVADEQIWNESYTVDVWKPWLEELILGGGLGTIMALLSSGLDIWDKINRPKKETSDTEKSR